MITNVGSAALITRRRTIIRRAKLLAESDDWKVAGAELAALYARWKKAGSAGRQHDDKLWATFNAYAAEFRKRRQRHFAELIDSPSTRRRSSSS